MKESLIFIFNFYEYYFYVISGIIGSAVAYHFCKNKLSHTSEKAFAVLLCLIENGIISTWLIHHSINQISGLPQPYLTAFLLKCISMIANGVIIDVIITHAIHGVSNIKKHSIKNWFGITTFLYLIIDLIINLPTGINSWCALWYATDYSMGVGSRFFIGTVLKLFYNDYLDSKVAYHFCFVSVLLIIVIISCAANVLYLGCKEEYRTAFSYMWILLLVSPGSVVGFWQSGNYGRLETYGFLLGMVCITIYGKIDNKNLVYCIITILSCISMAIYQGNIFMYYSLVLMIFIWEVLSTECKRKRTTILWGSTNLIVTSITFLIFQFFSNTIYGSASEMTALLSTKTDLPITEMAIDLELFEPVSVAFDSINKGFLLGSELPRERTLITFILVCPIILIFIGLYLHCFCEQRNSSRKTVFVKPHLYLVLLLLTIIPQYLLNVDWGRWMICTNLILFSGFFFLLWKGDEYAIRAMTCLNQWIKKHWVIAIFVVIYTAGLGKYNGRGFISQVNSITNWLVSNEWLVFQ